MAVRVKKIHPALKHGGYAAAALLPGEDPTAFEELHQNLIDELVPAGALEHHTVATLARLVWRIQHLAIHRRAERTQELNLKLRSESEIVQTAVMLKWYEILRQQPEGTWAEATNAETLDGLMKELAVEERLDAMIERCIKQLFHLKGLKSLISTSRSAPPLRISGPPKAA